MARRRLLSVTVVCLTLAVQLLALPTATPQADGTDAAIPQAAALLPQNLNVTTFLLLGTDSSGLQNATRTDVIILAFIHRETGTVSLLSLPRDLYVYIPGWQMQRINTAFPHGSSLESGSGGIELLRETLRYNLGVTVDKYARVDFTGFRQIIDALGGVDLSVDCAIQDWRLSDPGLDPAVAENWELVTLPVGVHHMDGDTALWYVRSRRTSSDFDRGRRQHDMLRAIWQRAYSLGLFERLPDLWQRLADTVETNITLPDAMTLLSLALQFDPSRVESYTFRLNREVTLGRSPEGASVLLPDAEAVARLVFQALTPATANQLAGSAVNVEVLNASGQGDMHRVAADRLAWEGVRTFVSAEQLPAQVSTVIVDYTGQSKGSALAALQRVLRVQDGDVIHETSASRDVDFRVILGSSYQACTYGVIPPEPPGN